MGAELEVDLLLLEVCLAAGDIKKRQDIDF
jgi:hypothetical protein